MTYDTFWFIHSILWYSIHYCCYSLIFIIIDTVLHWLCPLMTDTFDMWWLILRSFIVFHSFYDTFIHSLLLCYIDRYLLIWLYHCWYIILIVYIVIVWYHCCRLILPFILDWPLLTCYSFIPSTFIRYICLHDSLLPYIIHYCYWYIDYCCYSYHSIQYSHWLIHWFIPLYSEYSIPVVIVDLDDIDLIYSHSHIGVPLSLILTTSVDCYIRYIIHIPLPFHSFDVHSFSDDIHCWWWYILLIFDCYISHSLLIVLFVDPIDDIPRPVVHWHSIVDSLLMIHSLLLPSFILDTLILRLHLLFVICCITCSLFIHSIWSLPLHIHVHSICSFCWFFILTILLIILFIRWCILHSSFDGRCSFDFYHIVIHLFYHLFDEFPTLHVLTFWCCYHCCPYDPSCCCVVTFLHIALLHIHCCWLIFHLLLFIHWYIHLIHSIFVFIILHSLHLLHSFLPISFILHIVFDTFRYYLHSFWFYSHSWYIHYSMMLLYIVDDDIHLSFIHLYILCWLHYIDTLIYIHCYSSLLFIYDSVYSYRYHIHSLMLTFYHFTFHLLYCWHCCWYSDDDIVVILHLLLLWYYSFDTFYSFVVDISFTLCILLHCCIHLLLFIVVIHWPCWPFYSFIHLLYFDDIVVIHWYSICCHYCCWLTYLYIYLLFVDIDIHCDVSLLLFICWWLFDDTFIDDSLYSV